MAITLPDTRQLPDEVLEALRFRALHACELGFTQADVANILGVAPETVCRWWVAYSNGGLEAWAEYRKTGYPVTPQSPQVTDAKRPVRFYYPNTESGANSANVTAQGAIDVFATRLFWDVD